MLATLHRSSMRQLNLAAARSIVNAAVLIGGSAASLALFLEDSRRWLQKKAKLFRVRPCGRTQDRTRFIAGLGVLAMRLLLGSSIWCCDIARIPEAFLNMVQMESRPQRLCFPFGGTAGDGRATNATTACK